MKEPTPENDIVTFGYNRDGKRGHEQMVIALLCSAEGCPVGVEVFAGNKDRPWTVRNVIERLAAIRREKIAMHNCVCTHKRISARQGD